MENLANNHNEMLPEFQKFLLEKKLALGKNIPFHAYWVSLFFNYARKNELSTLEYQETTVLKSPLDMLIQEQKSSI